MTVFSDEFIHILFVAAKLQSQKLKTQDKKGSSLEVSSKRKSNPKDSHVKIHNFEELKGFSFSIFKN